MPERGPLLMPRATTLVALVASMAAVGVALDLPPIGPAISPRVHATLDLCSEPRTLAEAHDVLAQMLDPGLVAQLRSGTEREAVALSSTVGVALRNQWGLWNGSPLRDHLRVLGLQHADDMSELIFITFWRHLNSQPLRVEHEVTRLRAAHAAGDWRIDPRCRCLPVGRCRSTVITDPRLGRDRAFELTDCCCLRIPQIVEGKPLAATEGRVIVLPPAFFFREVACGPRFGSAR